jgi:pilus assembly protein CpaD
MSSSHLPVAKRRGIGAVRLLTILGCASALAGCYATQMEVTGAVPGDWRQRHPIALKEDARTLELFVGSQRGGLNGRQQADVFAFAHSWRKEATGGFIIDLPTGTGNATAAAGALREVRSILSTAGVPAKSVQVRPYRPNDPAKLATLKLSYPAVVATAGPCGLWPHDLGPTADREYFENSQYWNLGCASQRNLASMVDNPADLVQPRGEIPSYSGRRTTVMDKYHRGESSATIYTDTEKGKISDVGK